MSQDKTKLAKDRTDWAEDRTVLANERTFAGWLRTAMASLAIAIALQAIFGKAEIGAYPARMVASLFVAFAIAAVWISRNRAVATLNRLNTHSATPVGRRRMTVLATLMTFGALGTGVLLWLI